MANQQRFIKIGLVILIGVITIATRFVRLDWTPPALSNDEISIAYDSYSVGVNGKDEWNEKLPISFRSHNTYKAPMTAYLAIPTIKFFGNTENGVRLPSAILGSLTVLIIGLIGYELTKNFYLGAVAALFLAITPWHVYTSRMALESNVALFFLTWGIYLLIKKNWWGYLVLGLSIYSYHTEWGLAPLMAIVLSVFFIKDIKKIISGLIIMGLTALPIFLNFVLHPQNTRAGTQIFDFNSSFLSNVLGNYSGYFNLGYLFFDGLDLLPKEDYFQTGLLLFSMLPLFIWGLVKIKKVYKNNYLFILIWLLISPIIPSLTKGGTVYVRNLVTVVPIILIVAGGWQSIQKKYFKIFWGLLIFFSAFYSGVIFYFNFPMERGENFQYGYKQAAVYFKEHYNDYDRFVVDPRFGKYLTLSGVPHLYIGYFGKIDPTKIQNRINYEKSWEFDKYEFKDINWNAEPINKKALYLVPNGNLPEKKKYTAVKEIDYANGEKAFWLIKFD